MDQTPLNLGLNGDLLAMIPNDASRIVEVGCSGGGLAREYRKINPRCEYIGLEINAQYAEVAREHCTRVLVGDIEHLGNDVFESSAGSSSWIFGDVLEHLYDPWSVLKRIRGAIAPTESVIACIPNAQHWSMQARLNCGALHYEDKGLLDRTHIRFFPKLTIRELFDSCGYAIVDARARVLGGFRIRQETAQW